MAKSYNQKLKILYLLKFLTEQTDDQHVLTMQEILDQLAEQGIRAERKSIYDDMEALRLFGVDIENRKEQPRGYYLASREFELPELKLLVDAVQSSKFLSARKSRELIRKLEGLSSRHEARQLQRQVVVANRIKTMNESIYYNVDKIHSAISENRKISFHYFEWTVSKETRLRKDGARYQISPWALCWVDENYYLIGYDESPGIIKHFRVDKMLDINALPEERQGKNVFADFDLGNYIKMTFGMFGGTRTNLKLLMENRLIGVVMDRFGKDVTVRKEDEDHFSVRLEIIPSRPFYGWLAGLGVGARIVSPESEAKAYRDYLRDLADHC